MRTNNYQLLNTFVHLQDQQFLADQRIAGRVVSKTLKLLGGLVKEKTNLSLLELDAVAEDFIRKNGCEPTFLNYKGFPNSVCISVNRQLVHGIPTNYKLVDGDVVSFDLGATYRGAIADAAITTVYGNNAKPEHVKGIEVAEQCLSAAIAAVAIGKRIGVIGNAIFKTARSNGFDVIQSYGGHGISRLNEQDIIGIPHAAPFISNKASPEDGIRIQEHMTIAIEPLLVPLGTSTETHIGEDKWTVYTKDVSFHVEKTIYVHSDRVEIITET
jgi:methionyl aminopeptidase